MLVPFLIMLREGVEASLIVGIVASYLRQTGHGGAMRSVWVGVGSASLLCLIGGVALDRAQAEFPQRQQELFEGVVGVVAVVILSSMVFWMQKAARSMKATLHRAVDQAMRGGREGRAPGTAAGGHAWPLVLMVFFAVGREGLESVFFLLATFEQNVGIAAPIGAGLGLLCAVGVGIGIYAGGIRLDLRRFFRWTGIFIVFVAAGLVAGSVRAFHEAGLWNGLQGIAFDMSGVLPSDGFVGTALAGILGYRDMPTVGEVIAYLAYLLPALLLLMPRPRMLARRRASSMLGLFAAGLLISPRIAGAVEQQPVDVTVTRTGCEPATLRVSAGETLFRIHNASARAMEWEILDGVMVKEERENIAPGFVQKLTAHLEAGNYAMTCGLLNNPKGSLVVTPAVSTRPATPSALDLVGPLAAYKVYAEHETADLIATTRTLTDALKADDLAAARAAYAPAHLHYERIEPIAELFNDLDKSMDSRADDYEKKEADPGFIGFHRIEMALFRDHSTAGAGPVADRLLKDALTLQSRLADLTIPPGKMVGGAADLIEEVAATKITGEEDRYSRTDLWDFQGNVDGSAKIFGLLRPLVQRADPALEEEISANFGRLDAVLAHYRQDGGFKPYDALTLEDRRALKGPVVLLAEDLSKLRGTLGLE